MRRSTTAISPAAYSGGTFTIHQPNYANYFAQAQMHRMAKQQALSQYYDRVQESINPAGVRDVDMDGFQKRADEWNKYGIENRDNLVDPRRDGGKSLNQFNSMHRAILGYIQKSKQAGTQELALHKIYSDPRKSALATKNDLLLAHGISSPIDSPDHYKDDGVTPHDLSEFSFNAPPFDLKRQLELNKLVTSGLKKDRTYGKGGTVDPETRLTLVPYSEKHSNANLKTIAERTGQAFDGDPSMQQYQENKTLDPSTYDQYSKAYKALYPNDDIGTDPRKIAMAESIVRNSQVDTGSVAKSVSRPPTSRGLTKSQEDQQNTMGWINGMANGINSGDMDEVSRYGDWLYSGNGKSSYQGVEPSTVGKGIVLKHVNHQWVSANDASDPSKGEYKDVMNATYLQPGDPALRYKLGKIWQDHMGSSPAVERALLSLNQGKAVAPPPTPSPSPITNPADPDALIKKYSQ